MVSLLVLTDPQKIGRGGTEQKEIFLMSVLHAVTTHIYLSPQGTG